MRRCGACPFLRSESVYRIVSYHDDWQPPRAWRPAEADHPFQRRSEASSRKSMTFRPDIFVR